MDVFQITDHATDVENDFTLFWWIKFYAESIFSNNASNIFCALYMLDWIIQTKNSDKMKIDEVKIHN